MDLGANIGLASIYFAQCFEGCTIESYEPNPFNYQLLRTNTLHYKNINTFPYAVTTSKKEKYLYLAKGLKQGWTWGNSMIENHWDRDQNVLPLQVPTINVSKLTKTKIDILKIDVEGLEYRIIKKIGKNLKNINIILIEFHGTKTRTKEDLLEILEILKTNEFSVDLISNSEKDLSKLDSIDKTLFWIYAYKKL